MLYINTYKMTKQVPTPVSSIWILLCRIPTFHSIDKSDT